MAESELRIAVKLQPRDAEFLSNLGTVLAMQGKLEESTEFFTKALELAPTNLTVRRYLAANLWQMHHYPAAKQQLDFILSRKPHDPQARLLRGMVAENTEDYRTAVRMLATIPDQVNKQPEAIVALARSYYQTGQEAKARLALDRLSIHSGPQGVFVGAQIADQMHDYETAGKLLESIQASFPDPTRLQFALALVLYHKGRFADCSDRLLQLIASGQTSGEIYNLLAWSYHKQDLRQEATQALAEAIRIAPSDETSYIDLIRVLLSQRLLPSAMNAAKNAVSKFPESSRAYGLKGEVETQMGQFRDAIDSYTHAVRLDSASAGSALGLADAQSAAGMTKEASAGYERGIREFPKDTRFPVHYAVMLLKESDAGDAKAGIRAEQLLRTSLAVDPSLPQVHYQLGNLALKNGQVTEAVKFLEQAAKLDPGSVETHFALTRAYGRMGRTEDAAREMDTYNKLKVNSPYPAESPSKDASFPN